MALAWIALGGLAIVAFVASVAAVIVGVLWWVWTFDITAARVAATGLLVGLLVAFTAGRIDSPS